MSKKNFKLIIEYDGSNYHGWQIQPNGPSIQQEIETALETMTSQKVKLIGSGRTDAGVHALGQVANFSCDTNIPDEAFLKGLNSILAEDIVIRDVTRVSTDFHSRFDAKSKLYSYNIVNQPVPTAIERHYAWWIRSPLDLSAMEKAGQYLVGEKDFKAFEGAGSPRAHTIRHVMKVDIKCQAPGRIALEIQANGFLRYMVRNIVGTLVEVGLHKISPEQIKTILASKDRSQASATAPAKGLFLIEVRY